MILDLETVITAADPKFQAHQLEPILIPSFRRKPRITISLATRFAMFAAASSRILASGARRALTSSRSFHASGQRLNDAAPLPARKPMGAFRGGLFGFLFGSVLAGGAVYSYVLQEYKASNELLTEDIYVRLSNLSALGELGISPCSTTLSSLLNHLRYNSRGRMKRIIANKTINQTLQASVTRLTNHVKILEEKIQQKRK
ncbi:hypothetical protein ACSS6W_006536 [Trichoderma asperelloides]